MGAAHCRSQTGASRSHPVIFTQSLAGIGARSKQVKIVSCSFSLTVWRRRNSACFAKTEEVSKIDLLHRFGPLVRRPTDEWSKIGVTSAYFRCWHISADLLRCNNPSSYQR